MKFDFRKPAHLVALILMLITFFVVFIYPALVFAGFFESTAEIPPLDENMRLILEILFFILQLLFILVLLVIIPFTWYKLVDGYTLKEIFSKIRMTSQGVDMAFLWGIITFMLTYFIFF